MMQLFVNELKNNRNHFITAQLAYRIIILCMKYYKFPMGILIDIVINYVDNQQESIFKSFRHLLLAAAIPAAKLARLDTLIPTASPLQTCRWLVQDFTLNVLFKILLLNKKCAQNNRYKFTICVLCTAVVSQIEPYHCLNARNFHYCAMFCLQYQ